MLNNSSILLVAIFCLAFGTVEAQFRIKAVGDVMFGSFTPSLEVPENNGAEFLPIAKYLTDASLVFGNLEGSFATNSMTASKCSQASRNAGRCYEFGMPVTLAPLLKKLGITVVSLDNNHSEDYGVEGYTFTQKTLDDNGISFAPKKGYSTLQYGITSVGVVAFGFSSTSYTVSDIENAKKVVSKLSKKFDILIVSFHGGAEGRKALNTPKTAEVFMGEQRGNLPLFAKTVIDAGADLVLGHGPHVLRGMELYKDRLILYSMGNFLTYGHFNLKNENGITAIFDLTLDAKTGSFQKGTIIPIIQRGKGVPDYDSTKSAIPLLQRLTAEDFPETPLKISDNGDIIKQ